MKAAIGVTLHILTKTPKLRRIFC